MATPTKRRDQGASLVEFAFILPLFVVLIFGMVTGGIALSQQNSIKNAVREASRFAAVSPVGDDAADLEAYLDGVIQQVEDASTGDLGDAVDGNEICVSFTEDGTAFTTREKVGSTISDGDSAGCYTDNLGAKARTQVSAKRKTEISAIFFEVPIDLSSRSASRYER